MGFPKSAYGPNPNAGRNPSPKAWGGYQWPAGVPSSLLATARHPDRSDAYFQTRKELVPLWQELMHYANLQGYRIYGMNGSTFWGPWGYQNRAIGGTSSPSNHSAGIAADINAPNNPQSNSFVSDIPPGVVNAFETCGFYWGGRYTAPTKFDTMHFEYCFAPADVNGHLARARTLTGGYAPTPPPVEEDDQDMGLLVTADNKGYGALIGGRLVGISSMDTVTALQGVGWQTAKIATQDFERFGAMLPSLARSEDGRVGIMSGAIISWLGSPSTVDALTAKGAETVVVIADQDFTNMASR